MTCVTVSVRPSPIDFILVDILTRPGGVSLNRRVVSMKVIRRLCGGSSLAPWLITVLVFGASLLVILTGSSEGGELLKFFDIFDLTIRGIIVKGQRPLGRLEILQEVGDLLAAFDEQLHQVGCQILIALIVEGRCQSLVTDTSSST